MRFTNYGIDAPLAVLWCWVGGLLGTALAYCGFVLLRDLIPVASMTLGVSGILLVTFFLWPAIMMPTSSLFIASILQIT